MTAARVTFILDCAGVQGTFTATNRQSQGEVDFNVLYVTISYLADNAVLCCC